MDHDWIQSYGTLYRPLTLTEWLRSDGKPTRRAIGWGRAWALTREILKNHYSHSYASLAGWSYIPAPEEVAMWDQAEADKRLKRRGWRPWLDPRSSQFGSGKPQRPRSEVLKDRERLKARFHIQDD